MVCGCRTWRPQADLPMPLHLRRALASRPSDSSPSLSVPREPTASRLLLILRTVRKLPNGNDLSLGTVATVRPLVTDAFLTGGKRLAAPTATDRSPFQYRARWVPPSSRLVGAASVGNGTLSGRPA